MEIAILFNFFSLPGQYYIMFKMYAKSRIGIVTSYFLLQRRLKLTVKQRQLPK